MNVGDLLRERDRLLAVVEEAKSARVKLKQLNVLIAMYGDAEHVELVSSNGTGTATCDECGESFSAGRGLSTHKRTMHGERSTKRTTRPTCDECGDGPFKGAAGLTMHKARVHAKTITTPKQQKAKAS